MSTLMNRPRASRILTLTPRRPAGRQVPLLGASLLTVAVVVVGCTANSSATAPVTPASVTAVQASFVDVHRAPGCGCCHEWESYMQARGFTVEAEDDPDLAEFKASSGVPSSAQSCHTAVIDGYVVEGHVPVAAINDLLEERPDIDGIALPGMPPGSPGMPGEQAEPFEILALDNGTTSIFGEY